MVKISELWFDRKQFPLRLIDLQATLGSKGGVCFHRPSDWNFHVISHTWSQDIRDLSVATANVLSTSSWTNDEDLLSRGERYNGAFSKSQFAERSCYQKLMEFFLVLVADSTSKVWFDALCINQTDDEEKCREIRHMGAYYRLSSGCYVITHGIGSESGFAAVDPRKMTVPRWFTRAWTIQESILPNKLSFIVEKFDAGVIKRYHPQKSYISILCDQWMNWDDELEPTSPGDNSRRRAHKELYCLGAQAYGRMMQVAVHAAWYWANFTDAFGGLGEGINEIHVELLVELIQKRHCSVEEDRVLCLLGLLGFKGDYQLRTKQTLDRQLVGLAKMLMNEKPELLINLCVADFEGYGSPSISWLPDLRYAENRRFWTRNLYRHYVLERYEAIAKEVEDNGRLVLRARTLRGYLVKRWKTYSLELGALSVQISPHYEQESCLLSLEKESTNDPKNGEVRPSGGFSIPGKGIDKLHDNDDFKSLRVCEMMLVLLGRCHPCDYPHSLAMVCLRGDEGSEMQKLGILAFANLDDSVFPSSLEECVIGGFGDDVTKFLSKECEALVRSNG